jgi:predicted amidohydrolase YtcJ
MTGRATIRCLHGGTVRTMDEGRPTAAALVLEGDRIGAVLEDAADAPAGAASIDLGGMCALPGFTDAHVHFPSWAQTRRDVRLFGARSLAQAIASLEAAVTDHRPGTWLRGRGWRDALWPESERPTRQALDAVVADAPVALRSQDGHSLWLNSAALAQADGDLAVPGGVVEVDDDGEPTGILREESAWRFERELVEPSLDEVLEVVREALPAAAAAGVTAIHDKDGGIGSPQLFAKLRDAGELTLRVWQSVPAHEMDTHLANAPAGDDWLRVGYVKAFMDGTLGSSTARLLDGTGVEITSSARLADYIRRAARHRLPVAVHAIGDLANRDALNAFEETAVQWHPLGLRHRIEHAQCVHPDDVPRFAAVGITASVQFSHATSDRDLVERLWADRADHAYPFRSLLDAGTRLVNGSDAPVEELDPLAGLRAGVLRTIDDRPAWRPEQGVTVEDVLRASTSDAAWLASAEDTRGRLAPGYVADLVVLDRDPVTCAREELAEVSVVATMAGGRWVHGGPPW